MYQGRLRQVFQKSEEDIIMDNVVREMEETKKQHVIITPDSIQDMTDFILLTKSPGSKDSTEAGKKLAKKFGFSFHSYKKGNISISIDFDKVQKQLQIQEENDRIFAEGQDPDKNIL